MIFFVYQSKLCMATLVFYTCIYFPLLQMKRAILSIIGYILCIYHHPLEWSISSSDCSIMGDESKETTCSLDLPMSRYGDLKNINGCNKKESDGDHEETCSVCLVEFESEDLVSKLSKCGHVFHMVCIDKWVERNQFTCPLCRSMFLNVHGGSHATCNSTMISCISS